MSVQPALFAKTPRFDGADGFCACGCGQRTGLMPVNNKGAGLVKGQPFRFLPHHHSRVWNREASIARFWAKVDRSGGCWLWIGSVNASGYGITSFNGVVLAHRVSWQLANEQAIPDGAFICHHCDTPACVRPDHLFVGTAKDNVADMDRKGRRVVKVARGLAHAQSVMDYGRLAEIWSRYRAGQSQVAIGKAVGVSNSLVHLIVHGKKYQLETSELESL